MYMSDIDMSESIVKVISDSTRMGDNRHIYIDKLNSDIAKERIAFSLIAGALSSQGKFTSTILRFRDVKTKQLYCYQSSVALTYEAAMAFIYLKRIEGEAIVDVAYLCDDVIEGSSFISIEGLNTDTDIIKLSISDPLIPLVEGLIEDNQHRNLEKHRASITTLVNPRGSSLGFQKQLELGFSRTFGIQGRCEVKALSSPNKTYKVIYTDGVGGVIRGNRLTVATLDHSEYAAKLQDNIKLYTDISGGNVQFNCTGDIIMF